MFLQKKPTNLEQDLRSLNINRSTSDWWTKELFFATNNIPLTTQTWNPSDSEENYRKGVAEFAKQGLEYPWRPDSFNYQFNSHGFRGPELTANADFKILVSGCSFTEGIGLPYDQTWPELLAAKIPGAISINLGQGGHSGDYAARSIYKTIDIIKPNLVVVVWPPIPRYETIDKDGIARSKTPVDDNFHSSYTDPYYAEFQQLRNEAFLETTCKAANVRLIHTRVGRRYKNTVQSAPLLSKARDNKHLGKWWHETVSNYVYELFQSGRNTA
jgi:hypothetical protein